MRYPEQVQLDSTSTRRRRRRNLQFGSTCTILTPTLPAQQDLQRINTVRISSFDLPTDANSRNTTADLEFGRIFLLLDAKALNWRQVVDGG